MASDRYNGHDYLLMDELLTEEQKLIRDSARSWLKAEVSPIIEDYYEKAEFPKQILPRFGFNWRFWSVYSRGIWGSWSRSNFIWSTYARTGAS